MVLSICMLAALFVCLWNTEFRARVFRLDPICLVKTQNSSSKVPVYIIASDAEKMGTPFMHSDGIHVCVHVPKDRVFLWVKSEDNANFTPQTPATASSAASAAGDGTLKSDSDAETEKERDATGDLA